MRTGYLYHVVRGRTPVAFGGLFRPTSLVEDLVMIVRHRGPRGIYPGAVHGTRSGSLLTMKMCSNGVLCMDICRQEDPGLRCASNPSQIEHLLGAMRSLAWGNHHAFTEQRRRSAEDHT